MTTPIFFISRLRHNLEILSDRNLELMKKIIFEKKIFVTMDTVRVPIATSFFANVLQNISNIGKALRVKKSSDRQSNNFFGFWGLNLVSVQNFSSNELILQNRGNWGRPLKGHTRANSRTFLDFGTHALRPQYLRIKDSHELEIWTQD